MTFSGHNPHNEKQIRQVSSPKNYLSPLASFEISQCQTITRQATSLHATPRTKLFNTNHNTHTHTRNKEEEQHEARKTKPNQDTYVYITVYHINIHIYMYIYIYYIIYMHAQQNAWRSLPEHFHFTQPKQRSPNLRGQSTGPGRGAAGALS